MCIVDRECEEGRARKGERSYTEIQVIKCVFWHFCFIIPSVKLQVYWEKFPDGIFLVSLILVSTYTWSPYDLGVKKICSNSLCLFNLVEIGWYCKGDICWQCWTDGLSPGRSVSLNYEGEFKNLNEVNFLKNNQPTPQSCKVTALF